MQRACRQRELLCITWRFFWDHTKIELLNDQQVDVEYQGFWSVSEAVVVFPSEIGL